MTRRRKLRKRESSGFVLIVVLGVVLLLSTLLFGFSHTTRTQLNAADSFYRTEQAWNCARAGLHIAMAAIGDTNDICTDKRFAHLLTGENTFSVDDGSCSITIVAEGGLLNVNSLKEKNGRINRKRVDQFLRLIDLLNQRRNSTQRTEYGIVPAIIDWTDADEEVTQLPFVQHDSLGAEEDYYRTCDPPYHCRNKPVNALDELLWVKGMTPGILADLRYVLTCSNEEKININAAPRLVLESLSEQMDPALVEMILNRRRLEPFAHVADLKTVPGMTDNIYQSIKDSITTRSQDAYYRVTSQGNVADRSSKIEAVLRRNAEAGNVDIVLYREL